MSKDNFSIADINNLRREALVKSGVIELPTGYHLMPTGELMRDSDMKQDLADLSNVIPTEGQVTTDGSSNTLV